MPSLPSAAEPLCMSFSLAFTEPTFQRALVLMIGAILSTGPRTVTHMLWTVRGLVRGHHSSYHRVFSRAAWSLWPLGKILTQAVLRQVPADQPVRIPADDSVAEHKGRKVYGKGCHHDAVRSSHTHTVWRWGHKWVTLSILVKFPFVSRPWALPVLAALYRPEQLNRAEGRRHKTPAQLARQLLAVLIHWFPDRKFILLGDGGYASHELARFCHRHRRHATLVSRCDPDANLYDLPPARQAGESGRPRIKGQKRPTPKQGVARRRKGPRATVSWYGGTKRRVELISDTGQWYKSGQGLVPLRWVHVHDVQGTHRDDYLYSTDPNLKPAQIVSLFTGRWNIETTFQEIRPRLGFETTRQRVAKSVLRTGPCLLGLFSVVCLIFAEHAKRHRIKIRRTAWYRKPEPTFSDALETVRRLFWQQTIFARPSDHVGLQKLPGELRRLLLDQLSRAA